MAEVLSGTIVAFAGQSIPGGWDLCDGKEVSKTDTRYASLFRAISNKWGGDGNPNFKLPDLQGQFLMGVTNTNEIASGGGVPSHNHGGQTSGLTNADGYHVDGNNRHIPPQATGYLHGHTIAEASNLPPYKKILYLIKL